METCDRGNDECAGFKDCNIMVEVCVVRNTVKTIGAELEESDSNYQDLVDRKKNKRPSEAMRITTEGDVMPPHFFEKGLRLNSEGYV